MRVACTERLVSIGLSIYWAEFLCVVNLEFHLICVPTSSQSPCMTKSPSNSTQSTPPSTQTDTPESPSHANPDTQPLSPKHSRSTTPLHGTRPSALPLQSPSRQSLREARSPHKHQRRKSAPISNKTSPVAGKSKGGRCAGSPQSKAVPSCAQADVKFEDLSELERVKRVRVVAERVMRVSGEIGGCGIVCRTLELLIMAHSHLRIVQALKTL